MATLTYDEKMVLLMKYSRNRTMVQLLSRKQRDEKLDYELKKLSSRYPELAALLGMDSSALVVQKKTSPVVVKSVTATPNTESGPIASEEYPILSDGQNYKSAIARNYIVRNMRKILYSELPESLQKLWDETRQAYSQMRSLHEKLKLLTNGSDADRAPLAQKLISLSAQIRSNWDTIDAWDPDALLEPTEPAPLVIDHRKIVANRTYISRNIRKAATLRGEQKAALVEKLQIRYDELISASESVNDTTLECLRRIGVII